MDQRSAAQYGQYRAPMYSISVLPPLFRIAPPLSGIRGLEPPLTSPLPVPTWSRTDAGTVVVLLTTEVSAVPVSVLVLVGPALWFTPTTTTTAIMMTAKIEPPAI